jgi:hypothetical protein
MSDFLNTYFGPLSREYCVYFYFMSIIFGFLFLAIIISVAYFVIMHFKKVNTMFILNSFLAIFNAFLAYLVNRLLHTMCVKSI